MNKINFDLLQGENLNFKNLFSICVGKVFSNKIEFLENIEGFENWDTDLEVGKLILDERAFDVNYLGSVTHNDNMWFSAELEKGIPDEYIKLLIECRKAMKNYGVKDFYPIKVKTNEKITGEMLAMLCTAFSPNKEVVLFNGKAEGVNLYMFVNKFEENPELIKNSVGNIPAEKFIPRVMELISKYDLNHKLMIKSFLLDNNCDFSEEDNVLVGNFPNEVKVKFTFDEEGKMLNAESQLN